MWRQTGVLFFYFVMASYCCYPKIASAFGVIGSVKLYGRTIPENVFVDNLAICEQLDRALIDRRESSIREVYVHRLNFYRQSRSSDSFARYCGDWSRHMRGSYIESIFHMISASSANIPENRTNQTIWCKWLRLTPKTNQIQIGSLGKVQSIFGKFRDSATSAGTDLRGFNRGFQLFNLVDSGLRQRSGIVGLSFGGLDKFIGLLRSALYLFKLITHDAPLPISSDGVTQGRDNYGTLENEGKDLAGRKVVEAVFNPEPTSSYMNLYHWRYGFYIIGMVIGGLMIFFGLLMLVANRQFGLGLVLFMVGSTAFAICFSDFAFRVKP
jgi:hypothetical protein